jgi:hypothetical protein
MRAHRTPPFLVVLLLATIVAAGCETAVPPSPPSSSSALASATSKETAGPASPQPTTGALVPPEVVAANTTPWPVKSVTAGSIICAIGTDDRLLCWGGDPGVGPPTDGGYAAVTPSSDGTCAIRLDETLRCWGAFEGKPPKGRFMAVAVGSGGGCAIRIDGRPACWSQDDGAEVEDEVVPTFDPPEGQFTQLDMSENGATCALRIDGAIACWGDGAAFPMVEDAFISLGDGCAVRDTGELLCFEQADGPASTIPDGPFTAMSGGAGHGCAIRATGALDCWGIEGFDPQTGLEIPTRTPPGRYTAVSVGEYQACAVRTDERAVCWGQDDERVRPGPSVHVDVPPLVRTTTIDASWRGVPLASPVTGYDLEYALYEPQNREGGANGDPVEPAWVPWLDGTVTTSGMLQTARGGKYCFRARAHDEEGLIGSWTTADCSSVPLDDRELTVSPEWTPVEGDAYFLGTALRTTAKGATMRIANSDLGSVAILGTRCGGCGTFVIRSPQRDCEAEDLASPPPASCPPAEEEVDLRGALETSAVVVASNGGEEGYAGPIDIVVTSSGKPVIIDAVIFDLEIE